jgi:hypothetical protein
MAISYQKKNLLIYVSIGLAALFLVSCESDCCENSNIVEGKWLLYERGGSPGVGYFTEPVSPVPPQQMEFKSNCKLLCSVEGLTDYKFYSVNGDIVGLFKNYPGPSPDIAAFTHSYYVTFEDGNLELGFRYCDEDVISHSSELSSDRISSIVH